MFLLARSALLECGLSSSPRFFSYLQLLPPVAWQPLEVSKRMQSTSFESPIKDQMDLAKKRVGLRF